METKSRYEIIGELEEKKAKLLNGLANLGLVKNNLHMNIESAEEKLKEFDMQEEIQKLNIGDQLTSIEKSLDRLNAQKTK